MTRPLTSRDLSTPGSTVALHPLQRSRSALVLGFVALVSALASTVALAAPAGAHATLVSTSPSADSVLETAPAEVVLRFDESVSVELGEGLRAFGPDGGRVDRAAVVVGEGGTTLSVPVDDVGRGTYTVAWRVVSSDSHVLSGTFVYHVGEPAGGGVDLDPARPWLDRWGWLSRFAIFAGAAVAGGLGVLRLAIPEVAELAGRRAAVVMALAAGALALGSVGRLVVQVAEASGRGLVDSLDLVGDAVRTTRSGRFDVFRVGGALLVIAAAVGWSQVGRYLAAGAALAGAGVVAVANALSGHAWTVGARLAAVLADLAHQGAVAVWVGGLVALAVVPATGSTLLARRVSALALGSVAVVAVSGGLNGWLQLGELDALWSTAYGRTILAKLAVFGGMAGLGWWNRARLAELVQRGSRQLQVVRMETLLAAGALGLTAGLVALVPGRELVAQPFSATFEDDGGTVTVTVEPARTGTNALHLYFFDDARLARAVDAAEARVSTGDLPPRQIDLAPITRGHFSASGFSLPTPGRWRFTITSVSRGVPAELDFEVLIR